MQSADTHSLPSPSPLQGWTPLFYACVSGHEGTARLLVEHRADVNAKDNSVSVPACTCECVRGLSLIHISEPTRPRLI
eukprot:2333070-Rhodomonas_salina.1